MKKVSVIVLVMLMLGVMAGSVYAYGSITGIVYDLNGDPWLNGGDVIVYGEVAGNFYECADVPIDETDGSYDATLDCTSDGAPNALPDNFTMMFIQVDFDPGTAGTPNGQSFDQRQFPGSGALTKNLYTGTGPNAVNLESFSGDAGSSLPLLAGSLLLVLIGGTAVFLRKRQVN